MCSKHLMIIDLYLEKFEFMSIGETLQFSPKLFVVTKGNLMAAKLIDSWTMQEKCLQVSSAFIT